MTKRTSMTPQVSKKFLQQEEKCLGRQTVHFCLDLFSSKDRVALKWGKLPEDIRRQSSREAGFILLLT